MFDSILENDEIFSLLLKNGANIEHETIIGSTSLDLAVYGGCFVEMSKFHHNLHLYKIKIMSFQKMKNTYWN